MNCFLYKIALHVLIISFLTFLSGPLSSFGQSEHTDSLFTFCEKNARTKPAEVIEIATRLLAKDTRHKDPVTISKCNYYLGIAYNYSENREKALSYLNASTLLFRAQRNKDFECRSLNETGLVYYFMNENDSAMAYYTMALALVKENNLKPILHRINNNIGILFDRRGQQDKAILYFKEALRQNPDKLLHSYILRNLGKVYNEKGFQEEALKHNLKSIALCKELKDTACLIYTLSGLANTYYYMERDKDMLSVLLSIAKLEERAGLISDQVETYNGLGIVYHYLNEPLKAISYYKKAISLGRKVQYTKTYAIYANLAYTYDSLKNYKQAYQYFVMSKHLEDSVEGIQSKQKLDNLLAKYEASKKEQQIAMLQNEKQLQKLKLQKQHAELDRQTMIRNIIIIAAFLILIPFFILLIFYRQKMQSKMLLAVKTEEVNQQKILKLIREHEIQTIKANVEGREKERARIAQELHDGVAGSLAGIKLHLAKVSEQSEQHHGLDKIIRNIDGLYEDVRAISHNLTPHKLLDTTFIDFVRMQLSQLKENSSFDLDFICYPEVELNQLPDVLKIEVYRIIQELMANIIKHSETKFVEVQFTKSEEYINLIVEDTGKGFDTARVSHGIGLASINTRVNNFSGKLHIDSAKGRGTIINIDIPIPVMV